MTSGYYYVLELVFSLPEQAYQVQEQQVQKQVDEIQIQPKRARYRNFSDSLIIIHVGIFSK